MLRARSTSSNCSDEAEDAPVDIMPKEVRLTDEIDDNLPNTLVITVLQARHLEPAALRDTLSCYVKLSSLGVEYRTSVMTRTREPRWHEVFVFRALDWTGGVAISLRDRLPLKMHFLGQLFISSAEIANLPGMATQRWFALREKGASGKVTGAELELKVALVYTKANDQGRFETGTAAKELENDVRLTGLVVDQEDETEDEKNFRIKTLLRRETQEREATSAIAALKQGDYQVQVHVIEARDLKGENVRPLDVNVLSGTSDPYCQVEIMGVSKKTSTKYDTLGCVFDENLFFNFSNIGRNEVQDASIKIAVYDKERVLKDKLIGVYQLDCLSVYAQNHHELYRQWIAVHDNLSVNDRGIQGYLLVSVMVLGPGDALRVHDREAEVEQELADTSNNRLDGSTSISPLVLVPPTIDLKLQFLVVRVLRAEHLPAMDTGGLLTGAQKIDAYFQVVFAANPASKTSIVTVKGRGNLTVDFYEELWLPVHIPTFSRHIGLSIWDRDLTSPNELVGVTSHDFLQVLAAEYDATERPLANLQNPHSMVEGSADEYAEFEEERSESAMQEKREVEEMQGRLQAAAPRWYNLYGPPLKSTNAKRKQIVARHAKLGSTYRGRVLISMVRVESPRPEDGEKMHMKPMLTAERERLEQMTPKTVKYVLRGALYCGTELPERSSIGGTSQVQVNLSLGPYSVTFDSQEVAKDGTATFEQCLENVMELPADLTQIPDVIVTLSRSVKGAFVATSDKEEFVSVSFARFRAKDLFSQGFTSKCQWKVLKEETTRRQTRHALERWQNTGVLLLRLGFGRAELATRHPWINEGDSTDLFAPFRFPRVHREIRVHVFQARGLEASAEVARVPSPFVSVRWCGLQKRTTQCPSTQSPLFYESLVFLANVPATDVAYTPDIVVSVQDASANGNSTGILGELRLSVASAVRSVATAASPKPRWYELKRPRSRTNASVSSLLADEAGDGSSVGQVLIATQYIDHIGSAPPPLLRQLSPITPTFIAANLDIVALGVRHLKALNTLGVRRPHVEFELVGGYFVDGSRVKRTQSGMSRSLGNSKNANFLDHIVAQVRLPLDTLYAPQLQIRVCDSTLGGLHTTILASCILDLSDKVPWSPTYCADKSPSRFQNPSKHQTQDKKRQICEKSGRKERENLEYENQFLEESQPKAEIAQPFDDGVGVGDLNLPSSLYSHVLVNSIKLSDPALIEQRHREEKRRHNARKSALLLSHRNIDKTRGSVLGSLNSNNRDQEQHRAPYFRGRDWWISQYGGEELEKYFSGPALETYQLKRPLLSRPSLLSFERVRVQLDAGVFKGRITVTDSNVKTKSLPDEEERAKEDLLALRQLQNGPQALLVRVYVLRGHNLQAKNSNGYSDPYMRLKLGNTRINDRPNACKNTLHPQFFRMFEIETTLPGASQLDLEVWDRNLVTDQLIGLTTIDLEERWFHREWQEIGKGEPSGKRKLKPIEYRHLYVPQSRTTSQGFLQLWVDILTTQEAVREEPVSISLPEPKLFEVRVVVWRAEGVQDQAQSEINDYFVKAWMEGGDDSGGSQVVSTDTHWRCSNGKPCWNWRLIMRTEFPPRSPELARLHLQLWDRDLAKWNDVLGEAQLDLYKWLRHAYDTNRSVSPFLELKRLAQKSILPDSEPLAKDVDTEASENGDANTNEDDVELVPREDNALLGGKVLKKKPFQSRIVKLKNRQENVSKNRNLAKKKADEADAEAAIKSLLDFMGLGQLPDDAEWIPIFFTDREAAVSVEMGRIGISIQIVPEEEALVSPAGKGQNAPNMNPYLPPPVGRMRYTANPIAMLKVLIGPQMCLRLALMCCCAGCVLFISVFGATVMSTLTYLHSA